VARMKKNQMIWIEKDHTRYLDALDDKKTRDTSIGGILP
jgi:hypothetical protein